MFWISFLKEIYWAHYKSDTYLCTIFRVLLPTYDWNYSSLLYFWKFFRLRYPLFSIAVQPIVNILGVLWPLLLAPSTNYLRQMFHVFIFNFFKEKITELITRVTHNLSTIFRVLLPTYDWHYSSLLYFWKLFRLRYPLF